MQRRTFCKSTLAAGIAATIPGCGQESAPVDVGSTIDALTGDGQELSIATSAVRELSDALQGDVLLPDDGGYDTARKIWNGMFDKRPALIAQCHSKDDVVKAVSFAQERSLLVAAVSLRHGDLTEWRRVVRVG